MLSEHHDIAHEFPDWQAALELLRSSDPEFDEMVKRHDRIDNEIRVLEEEQQPISDEEIEKLKYERAALKDEVYQRLRTAREAS
jgi:uncharacterized protein YdcH (DUF465 family)